ncbi:MAG: hypothetical protein KJ944_00095 [Alphaproteobacteria bacterium]|nr:hypothetical protein [Alphaproteobacteria bacterium]MBU1561543.1 hypothetical protein [Alphaproteobacteria bacterium]MBU2300974.1 hypothetical protein [Alphaproteobacteria bacterium]MBU2367256.1 hypothetical protein [Alphaproteobacteria bacterium]
MDYRGVGFGGDGNLEIIIAIVAVWLAVFVFVRVRKAVTGKEGNVGDITFSIVINVVFGLILAGFAFIPAWFVSSILIIGYAGATGQTPQDLVTLHWWLLGGAFVVAGAGILWWLRPGRSAV